MSRSHIEYTPSYGRYRNLTGNWQYQEMSNQLSPQCRSRKKQYPLRKCQIQKYRMLNIGQSFLPKVDDLILDISDIHGTHTDTIKSQAVRNRLIAKKMRESRAVTMKTEQQRETPNEFKPVVLRTIPKQSYHIAPQYTPMKLAEYRNGTKAQGNYRISTEPNQVSGAREAEERMISKPKAADTVPAPAIQYNPECPCQKPKQIQIPCNKARRLTTIQPHRYSEQLDSLEEKVLSQHKRQLLLSRNRKMVPRSGSSRLGKPYNENAAVPQRVTRINPTFLSYGSEYLINRNNYLANYGKRSMQS